jgi:hypothetical protein
MPTTVPAFALFTPRQLGLQTLVGLLIRVAPLGTILSLVKILGVSPMLDAALSAFVIGNSLMMFHSAVAYPMLLARAAQPQFDLKESVGGMMTFCLLVGAFLGCAVYFFAPALSVLLTAGAPIPSMIDSLHWMALVLFLSLSVAPLRGALSLKGYFNRSILIPATTWAVLGVLAYLYPQEARTHLTRMFAMLTIIEVICTILVTRITLGMWPPLVASFISLKGAVRASRWLLPAFILQMALFAIDAPTAALAGAGAVSIFQSVFRIPFVLMWSVSGAVSGLIGAAISRRAGTRVSTGEFRATWMTALQMGIPPMLLALGFTGFFLKTGFAGAVTGELWRVAIISSLMLPVWSVSSVFNKFFDVWSIQHYLPRIYMGVLGVRVVVTYPLVHYLGIEGVALTLLIGQLALLGGHLYFIRKVTKPKENAGRSTPSTFGRGRTTFMAILSRVHYFK